jgi:hypothetical protein
MCNSETIEQIEYALKRSFRDDQYSLIRKLERLGEWELAAKYWNEIHRPDDAKACTMIAESIAAGDRFRAATKHIFDWVDTTVADGLMTKEAALAIAYPQILKIKP